MGFEVGMGGFVLGGVLPLRIYYKKCKIKTVTRVDFDLFSATISFGTYFLFVKIKNVWLG